MDAVRGDEISQKRKGTLVAKGTLAKGRGQGHQLALSRSRHPSLPQGQATFPVNLVHLINETHSCSLQSPSLGFQNTDSEKQLLNDRF